MNETLQQFCQRILPVVQAGAEGKAIEEKGSSGNGIWDGKISTLFLPNYEYRIAKPKATPLPITPEMWAMIDPKYKFAYLNHIGDVWFSMEEIKWNGGAWDLKGLISNHCESPLAIDTAGIVPELSLTERPVCDDESLTPVFIDGVRVGTLNKFGEITGSYHDPDLTRKELDRLSDEHLAKVAPDGWINGVKTALRDVTLKPLPKRKLRFVRQDRLPDIYADFLREAGATQDNHVDATHYAESMTGDHIDLYKKMPDKWMIWNYDLRLWQPVQIFGAEPNPIK